MEYFLNSTEKGSSFKNTHGYLNWRLNLASICSTLDIAPLRSLLRASITKVALALRGYEVTCETIRSKDGVDLVSVGVTNSSRVSLVWLMSKVADCLDDDHFVDNLLNDE